MRAAVFSRFGAPDVVEVRELPTPVAGAGEILVRVEAASVGAADSAGRSGRPRFARLMFGFGPRDTVLGSDFAGTVVSVGDGVTEWMPGDRVFGATGASWGGHAEYLVVKERGAITTLPEEVSVEQAVALVDGAMTALPFLRDVGHISAGMRVVVVGASGAVGAAAVQLAQHRGAHVTAVTTNTELARGLGADETIDYRETDFTDGSVRYDIVFDAVGASSYGRAKRVLTTRGVYLTTVPGSVLIDRLLGRRARIAFTGLRPDAAKRPDLAELAQLAAAGILTPTIDSVYALDDIRAAHARVDTGRKRGTVVVRPA
ncbi:NADPH:quinone reductase-like Zn-dependent oxidoreductase [Microbacteriaceae bacterium SG_E_30_P1]|uniref:NADPH:quinone reductase-like Zn-dependent oxidoreductase n=1 Tax=Antiquaquibacter oligotrophicus TaxID=2880260 RepID=A0ABT6KSN2_9MICO|nr:NAD(P)-dependent alcohol dehydrogenase [Antiquaquibacter oligotrophicus]MDH6182207.1 NADPH:quinone reductase-like Zn-dependent oxidoreductase [Antiquaquibacter oligotrophicus]UDF12133.1 NAD(P)-dependent alcohol dehydrogenase [Antiquaquibacter oligotrophicus]